MREGISNNKLDIFGEEFRHKWLWLALIIVLLSLTLSATYAQTPEPQINPNKVLFVGNSYTFFHNLPLVVSAMAKTKGIDLVCNISVAGGATLDEHIKGKKKLNTLQMIKTGKYNDGLG